MIPAQSRLKQDWGREQGGRQHPAVLHSTPQPWPGVGGWTPSWEAASVFMEGQFLSTMAQVGVPTPKL